MGMKWLIWTDATKQNTFPYRIFKIATITSQVPLCDAWLIVLISIAADSNDD